MEESKENFKNSKIFYDYKGFQGFTFEENIKNINSLYFGQAIRISNLPFIFTDEKDKKNYLSANRITINDEIFYYPKNFLYLIFYWDNLLFYLDNKKMLKIFQFKENSYIKYTYSKSELLKADNCENKKIKDIVTALEKIKKNENLYDKYCILC